MLNWFKKLKEIVACHRQLMHLSGSYEDDLVWLNRKINAAEQIIKDRTDISADVHFHGHNRNQIIVTGRYRKMDYVQVFTLADNELASLINQLRDMERFGVVDKVDAIRDMKYVIERELQL